MKYYFIDLFCGAGGVTSGVHRAKFRGKNIAEVIACVNHDTTAIETHAENHPEVLHYIEDIRKLDLTALIVLVKKIRLTDPDAVICLWASLECTNGNPAGWLLFNRHYSKYHYKDGRNSSRFVGPGFRIVLVTQDGKALFVWRKFKDQSGQQGVNCSVFRNESILLSSKLILEAEQIAWNRWPTKRK